MSRAITKSGKRRRQTLDVLPPEAILAARRALADEGALGLWVLLAEVGTDGPAAMEGTIEDVGPVMARYRHENKWWPLMAADAPLIEAWQQRRTAFRTFGSPTASRELAEWLSGPITTRVRQHLAPAAFARHISLGVRVLNAVAREQIVALTNGHEPTLWELTGRIGLRADDFEPHSSSRVHSIINDATRELLHPRVSK